MKARVAAAGRPLAGGARLRLSVVTVEGATTAGTLAAFRSRDFRLLWMGQAISLVGDGAFIVALGWRVTDLTGDVKSLGFVLSLHSLAMLTTLLWGGVLADRHSRRLLMIVSDLARGAVLVAFVVVEATGRLSLPVLLVLAVLYGFGDGFFYPAFGGIVPLVVDDPLLASANSWINIARQGSTVIGPAVAAGLYGFAGPTSVWGVDAVSFAASALLLLRTRPRALQPEARQGAWRELAAGFRYVVSVPWLWTGIAAATVILMVAMAPYTALLPSLVRQQYHRGVGSYGLLFSLMAAGMVAGSLLWARAHPRRHRVLISFLAFAINDVGMIVVAVSPWYELAAAAVVWRGFWIGVALSAWSTLLTELVPGNLLSRVVSLDVFGSFALTPIGFALAGAAATMFTPAQLIAFGGVVGFLLWLVPLTWRDVRETA
jgi:MFS family permease